MDIKATIGNKDSNYGIQFTIRQQDTNHILGWVWVNEDLTRTYWTYDNKMFKGAPNWDKAVYQALIRTI